MRKDVAVVHPASLDVHIELLSSLPPAGTVVLTNRASSDLHLWRRGSLWGDETLSFEVTQDGRTERITLKPQDYTVNVPLWVTVAPGGRYDIRFNLADGSWEPEAIIKGLGTLGLPEASCPLPRKQFIAAAPTAG